MSAHQVSADAYEIGGKIREAREAAGLTQEQLAAMMDCSGNIVSRYEIGNREMRVGSFFRVADALHVSPVTLVPDRYQHSVHLSDGMKGCKVDETSSEDESDISEIVRLLKVISPADRSSLLRMARLMEKDALQAFA